MEKNPCFIFIFSVTLFSSTHTQNEIHFYIERVLSALIKAVPLMAMNKKRAEKNEEMLNKKLNVSRKSREKSTWNEQKNVWIYEKKKENKSNRKNGAQVDGWIDA